MMFANKPLATELAIVARAAASVEDGLPASLDLLNRDATSTLWRWCATRYRCSSPAIATPAGRRRRGAISCTRSPFTRSQTGTAHRGPRPRPRPSGRHIGPPSEAALDYGREDALANEQHQRWHQMHPFSGLFPADWLRCAQNAQRGGLAKLLNELVPRGPLAQWRQFVGFGLAQDIADAQPGASVPSAGFSPILAPAASQAIPDALTT